MKNKCSLLFFLPFLIACNSYTGPVYEVSYDDGGYAELSSVQAFQEKADTNETFVFVISSSTCRACEDLASELDDYTKVRHFSVSALPFDQKVTSEENYEILEGVINKTKPFIPAWQVSFFVPVMFIIQEGGAVYSIEENFTSTLDKCLNVINNG